MATIQGTAGDDSLLGTSAGDDFHLEQGGEDSAAGGAGIDVFYMGAGFDAGDHIDGGTDQDFVVLDGDYSAGVTLTATTLVDVEEIDLVAGHSYGLAGLDAIKLKRFTIDGHNLGAGDQMVIDGSERRSALFVTAGAGDDSLAGGGGNDRLNGGAGSNTLAGGAGNDQLSVSGGAVQHLDGGAGDDNFVFTDGFNKADRVVGGDGVDSLSLVDGAATTIAFGGANLQQVEQIFAGGGGAFHLILNDKGLAAGDSLAVYGNPDGKTTLDLDGSHESDGHLILNGGALSDTLTGGAQADTINGGAGDDTLIGGAGDDVLTGQGGAGDSLGDKLVGGLGADTLNGTLGSIDRFFYLDVADSSAAAPDLINKLDPTDVIWLRPIDADTTRAGNQAFHLVDAFDGHAGELTVTYDSFRQVTNVSGDVDGDGQADLVIVLDGNHAGFANFVL